ncbi:MAG: BspA family leucine-rich repeat surface protein, partial [Clostridia bacterium]
ASLGHTDDYIRHSYVEPGEYTVILKGDNVTSHWLYINTEGIPYTDLDGVNIDESNSLMSALPNQVYKAIQLGSHTKSAIGLFYEKRIMHFVNKNLFKYCRDNITNLRVCFNGCSSLNNITTGLFDECVNVTDFSYCFYYCITLNTPYNLTSEGLPKLWERAGLEGYPTSISGTEFADGTGELFSATIPNSWGGSMSIIPEEPTTPQSVSSFTLKGLNTFIKFNEITKPVNINWGDGKITTASESVNAVISHDYETEGEYVITLEGGEFTLPTSSESNELIVNIDNLYSLNKIDSNCKNVSIKHSFYSTTLKEVKDNCFDNFECIDFSYAFDGCVALNIIPENIFSKNININNFQYCFRNCTNIKSITNGLFANNTKVTAFKGCFAGLKSITTIPNNLFANNTEVIDFSECFFGCNTVYDIPTGLFDNNINAVDFSNCFAECNFHIACIPANLFNLNVKAENFSGLFKKNPRFNGIPAGLFSNNINAINFDYCFYDNMLISRIPVGLFDNNVNAINFSNCFYGCSSIETIPVGLFDNNIKAEDFSNCFSKCYRFLNIIPSGLFDKNINVTNFSGCFSGNYMLSHAYNLTSEGLPKLWERAGMEGYPASIKGDNFAYDTSLEFSSTIPTTWGGTMVI